MIWFLDLFLWIFIVKLAFMLIACTFHGCPLSLNWQILGLNKMQNIFVFVTIVSSSMVIIVDVANVVVFHYSGESPRRQFLITQSNHYLSKGKGFLVVVVILVVCCLVIVVHFCFYSWSNKQNDRKLCKKKVLSFTLLFMIAVFCSTSFLW